MKYDPTRRKWWERLVVYRQGAWQPWCWKVSGGGGGPLRVKPFWFF